MKKYVLATIFAITALTPALAEAPKLPVPTMAIKGEGEYSVKPDYATFTLMVETRNVSASKAMTAHADKIEKISTILESLKAEALSVEKANFTSRVEQKMERDPNIQSGSQSFTRPLGPPETVLTTVYNLKTRKIDAASLTSMADRLASGDLYNLSSLSFATDDSRKPLLEARKKAVQDAREQAEAYAQAANVQLVEIAEITDADASEYRYGASDVEADLPRRLAPVPGQKLKITQWVKVSRIVPPETLRFRASVNIMWRIGSKQ